jgi:hypothetical protein
MDKDDEEKTEPLARPIGGVVESVKNNDSEFRSWEKYYH